MTQGERNTRPRPSPRAELRRPPPEWWRRRSWRRARSRRWAAGREARAARRRSVESQSFRKYRRTARRVPQWERDVERDAAAVPAQQLPRELEMSGARDGKELRHSLYEPEQRSLPDCHGAGPLTTSPREPSTIRPAASVGEAMTSGSRCSRDDTPGLGGGARQCRDTRQPATRARARAGDGDLLRCRQQAADAFNIAFPRVPNLLRDLFAEGALSRPRSFRRLPRHCRRRGRRRPGSSVARSRQRPAARHLGDRRCRMVCGAGDRRRDGAGLCRRARQTRAHRRAGTAGCFRFLLFVALAAAATGMLNSFHRFATAAMAPLWFNVGTILVTIALVPVFQREGLDPILALATGVLVGGVLQLVFQLPTLFRLGLRPAWPPDFRHPRRSPRRRSHGAGRHRSLRDADQRRHQLVARLARRHRRRIMARLLVPCAVCPHRFVRGRAQRR